MLPEKGFLSKLRLIAKKVLKIGFFSAVEVGLTILTVLSIVLMIFGAMGIVNTIVSDFVIPQRFAGLQMPKRDFSDDEAALEPTCDIFAYWPKTCQPQLIPGTGLRVNRTMIGTPLRANICDRGGELWSASGCRSFLGLGDKWTDPCGFAGLGCRPLCYKTTLDRCPQQNYKFMNSSSFLNAFSPVQPSPIHPYMFTNYAPPRPNERFFMVDFRPVDHVSQCVAHCDGNEWCKGYAVQVPSKEYSMSMKCTLLSFANPSNNPRGVQVQDFRQIVGSGRNSLAGDDRWAPFVLAFKNDVFP
jgi:hypothetical protein